VRAFHSYTTALYVPSSGSRPPGRGAHDVRGSAYSYSIAQWSLDSELSLTEPGGWIINGGLIGLYLGGDAAEKIRFGNTHELKVENNCHQQHCKNEMRRVMRNLNFRFEIVHS
jgi:hypothetical protein